MPPFVEASKKRQKSSQAGRSESPPVVWSIQPNAETTVVDQQMDDIQRADRAAFKRELFRIEQFFLGGGWMLAAFLVNLASGRALWALALYPLAIFCWICFAWKASEKRRFLNRHYEVLWNGCVDRLTRFEEVLQKARRSQVAELQEMPKTIRQVGDSLYAALRRADIIAHEVMETEKGIAHQAPVWNASPQDPQARELYRLADKNIAEYRHNFAGVMAGVQRAEAQAAVYMTTLDSIRMKLLGYRLVGKSPELSSQEFMETIAEAKLQLQAIDQALDELDFTQFPKTISVMPPPPPVESVGE